MAAKRGGHDEDAYKTTCNSLSRRAARNQCLRTAVAQAASARWYVVRFAQIVGLPTQLSVNATNTGHESLPAVPSPEVVRTAAGWPH